MLYQIGFNSIMNAWVPSSIPGLGRSAGEGEGYSLQYSSLEDSGVAKSQTRLSDSLSFLHLPATHSYMMEILKILLLLPHLWLYSYLNIFIDLFMHPVSYIRCCCRCSVTKSCPSLCHPMGRGTPGFTVLHCLPEFVQTYVHWLSDAI